MEEYKDDGMKGLEAMLSIMEVKEDPLRSGGGGELDGGEGVPRSGVGSCHGDSRLNRCCRIEL